MKLEFFSEDLKPEHKDVPTSAVRFEHLNDEAQTALRIVGRGTYHNDRHDNYNAVYPPKNED